jgi:hypothetical protein
MPRAAIDAALDTFALVLRERHPGVIALPLRDTGVNGAVLEPGAGQVIRPFAAPEGPRPVLDWDASVTALDYAAPFELPRMREPPPIHRSS